MAYITFFAKSAYRIFSGIIMAHSKLHISICSDLHISATYASYNRIICCIICLCGAFLFQGGYWIVGLYAYRYADIVYASVLCYALHIAHIFSIITKGRRNRGGQFHCAKFWAGGKLSSESLLVRQFLSESYGPKMQKFWLKTSILGKYRGRIEFLNISDLLCRKFAAVCWNSIESL